MVPSVKDQTELVTIDIETNDIIRVLANLGDKPLIFLLLKADACKSIREALKMKKKKHYFLDVKSRKECQKRICLVPNFISPENAQVLRSNFDNLLQEIDLDMAQQIYELSEPKLELSNGNESSPEKPETTVTLNGVKPLAKMEKNEPQIDALAIRNQMEDQLNKNELQKLIYKKEIKKFNFAIAEIVKKYLSRYYKPKKLDPKMYKITSRAEYSNLAKMFSHKFREEISRQYFEKHFSFQGIRTSKGDEMDIKIQMEIYLQNRLKLAKTEFVGYSV